MTTCAAACSQDRRCFAFFHPQLPDEPLIFVEVALPPDMPAAIAPLIDQVATPQPAERFRVACFYSISNCEPGLRGVSLGNSSSSTWRSSCSVNCRG